MAPVQPTTTTATTKKPSARTLRHQRITGQIHPLLPSKIFRPNASVSDSFLSSKRDKRTIKHSSFVSRIASTSSSSRVGKSSSALKRRRPGKKLRTDLVALADALPELAEGGNGNNAAAAAAALGKVRHRSLKSKKGALRRKEMVVRGEMERFGASMAKLAGVEEEQQQSQPQSQQQRSNVSTSAENAAGAVGSNGEASTAGSGTAPAPSGSSNRWAALRGYISSTMEQNPAFANQKS